MIVFNFDGKQGVSHDKLYSSRAGNCSVETVFTHTNVCQGERTKIDRFVDPNVRGAKRRVYSDLRIYCNTLISLSL